MTEAPFYFRHPRPMPEQERLLFFTKIKKIIERAYLTPTSLSNPAHSTVDYFAVPKGDSDIRPVFNGTSFGLNPAL